MTAFVLQDSYTWIILPVYNFSGNCNSNKYDTQKTTYNQSDQKQIVECAYSYFVSLDDCQAAQQRSVNFRISLSAIHFNSKILHIFTNYDIIT